MRAPDSSITLLNITVSALTSLRTCFEEVSALTVNGGGTPVNFAGNNWSRSKNQKQGSTSLLRRLYRTQRLHARSRTQARARGVGRARAQDARPQPQPCALPRLPLPALPPRSRAPRARADDPAAQGLLHALVRVDSVFAKVASCHLKLTVEACSSARQTVAIDSECSSFD